MVHTVRGQLFGQLFRQLFGQRFGQLFGQFIGQLFGQLLRQLFGPFGNLMGNYGSFLIPSTALLLEGSRYCF